MQKQMIKLAAIALASLLTVPAGMAWTTAGDGAGEPGAFDEADFMHLADNAESKDKVYFNGYVAQYQVGPHPPIAEGDRYQPQQVWHFRAQLGFWRDCNDDGFVGSALLGAEEYPIALGGVDTTVCPEGSLYNKNGLITEFLWIGPDANGNNSGATSDDGDEALIDNPLPWNSTPVGTTADKRGVNDSSARVWGDYGRPEDAPGATAALFPPPHGSLSSWEGHIGYVPQSVAAFVPQRLNETTALVGVDASYEDAYVAGRALDNLTDSPVAIAKNRYNESETEHDAGATEETKNCGRETACSGPYAQPIVLVFDCSAGKDQAIATPFVAGNESDPTQTSLDNTMYWTPSVSPAINPDGSLDGTVYQNTRARLADDSENTGGTCGDTGDHLPYGNLEQPSTGSVGHALKREHNIQFSYSSKTRTRELNDQERAENTDASYYPIPYTNALDGHTLKAGTGLTEVFEGGWSGWFIWFSIPDDPAQAEASLGDYRRESFVTYYAYVSPQAFEGAMSSTDAFPSTKTFYYGGEQCGQSEASFGKNLKSDSWDCDPDKWVTNDPTWGIQVGQVYQVRDTDCYDGTVAGVTTPRPQGDVEGNTIHWTSCDPDFKTEI